MPVGCSPWPPPPAVSDVGEATLTRHERPRLGLPGGGWFRRLRGAVHDQEGWVVPQSQRVAGRNDRNVPSDPPRLAEPVTDAERLPGQWYYLGHWMWQYGHFLFETLPTLWSYRGEPTVAHRFGDDGSPAVWQRRLMELAGAPTLPRIVDTAPLTVEQLRVPTRPTVVGASASAVAVDVWQTVSRAASPGADLPPGQGRLVALSRARLGGGARVSAVKAPRQITNADALDDVWRRYGFEVVHPELLSVDEQLRVVREARVLMGVDGSALHSSAFVRPGTPIVLVGNRPRPRGNLTQRAIDAAMGNPLAVLGWRGRTQTSLDIDLEDHERKLDQALATLP